MTVPALYLTKYLCLIRLVGIQSVIEGTAIYMCWLDQTFGSIAPLNEMGGQKTERKEEKRRNHIHLFPGVWLWSVATNKSMPKPASALQLNQCHRRENSGCLSCWCFFFFYQPITSTQDGASETSWTSVNNHCLYRGWSGGEGGRLKLLRRFWALK